MTTALPTVHLGPCNFCSSLLRQINNAPTSEIEEKLIRKLILHCHAKHNPRVMVSDKEIPLLSDDQVREIESEMTTKE